MTRLFRYNGDFYYLSDYDIAQEYEKLEIPYNPAKFAVYAFDTEEERENYIKNRLKKDEEIIEFYSF